MMKTFLFVCVHNAGRSVMAEAFCNALGEGNARGISAGTMPSEHPHPEVVAAMKEVGIDVSGHTGLMLDDAMVRGADGVFTMGCAVDEGVCPAILYADVEDWGLQDPKGRPMEEVRAIRDDIKHRVERLLTSMPA
jgi:arsenate reductase (thioredoxin)